MTSKSSDRGRGRDQVLQAMLEERRREIHDKLRFLRETLPADVTEVKDDEERSVSDFVRDMDFALMEMKAASLARIDEALHRLEAGTYGACEECGGAIPAARLKALPFASLCLACQQDEESRTPERPGWPGASPATLED